MIINKKRILPLLFLLIYFYGCRDEMEVNKYERPKWLVGKLYTQIIEQAELSTFARCIELSGYDSIINTSGSFTVFAPSNEAFNTWLAQNPNYNSVENIPIPELTKLVKYHIIQNPWSEVQLRSLDIFGWIDTLDVNNDEPKGYKRETLFEEPDRKFGWSQLNDGRILLGDTLSSTIHRRVITDSRKYIPFFYQEYFNVNNLLPNDYEFYFKRPFEGGNSMYVANGMIVGNEIFAENGFIYKIDQIVQPLQNAYEILESGNGATNYSQFLDLINHFSHLEYNQAETFQQEGFSEGFAVDSLFDLTFPELAFNLISEETHLPTGSYSSSQNVTVRYHHGLMAPTDNAFENLINNYIKIPNGWGSLYGAPKHIQRIIANTHLSINPVYPSSLEKGILNGEEDILIFDEANIIQEEYGSNATFIGLNEAIVPRAFSSITGPVYLRQIFSKIMYAIEQVDLLTLLKRKNKEYMFFVESDINTSADSSLYYDAFKKSFSVFEIDKEGNYTEYDLSKNDIRTLILNHIADGNPRGVSRKEFIPNLAGNFLIFNNETGEVSGTGETTEGFHGVESVPEFPEILFEADNGTTFEINNWFSFSSSTLFNKISSQFPSFHSLLRKAGFSVDKEYRYNFISDSEFYTIFVPSQAAIDSSGLNSMPVEELRKVLQLHFVQGELIFTDGNIGADYFETVRVDEKSTPFSTIYSKLYIEPGIDVIRFKDKNGGIYSSVNESEVTNLLVGINTGTGEEVFPTIFNNGVIHEIDKVLIFEELDTQ